MAPLRLKLRKPHLQKGYLHIDSSIPIPFPEDGFGNCYSYESGFVLGYYVGTSFRIIACGDILDDLRLRRYEDSLIHPGRDYAVLLVNNSIHRVL